ncbi:MAG: MBL fold metallo-hydrolase [Bacteroidia bacterium]|nr:MBL fold metallo-hydrolase [Bacteroidia bacterium]
MNQLHLQDFTFNPYEENTYLIWDESRACAIIDPGCHTAGERALLQAFIEKENLRVSLLLNTHGHIDHMLGNHWVRETWQVPFVAHAEIVPELEAALSWGPMMGLNVVPSPMPDQTVTGGDRITLGDTELEVVYVPGHALSHIAFYHRASEILLAGDVLFRGSIGRTDLPRGNHRQLMESIVREVLPLGEAVRVYPGHGPMTTIGLERRTNPFVLEYLAAR